MLLCFHQLSHRHPRLDLRRLQIIIYPIQDGPLVEHQGPQLIEHLGQLVHIAQQIVDVLIPLSRESAQVFVLLEYTQLRLH